MMVKFKILVFVFFLHMPIVSLKTLIQKGLYELLSYSLCVVFEVSFLEVSLFEERFYFLFFF